MLKTLLTTSALAMALAAPSFAETEDGDMTMDTDMEATFEAADAMDTDAEGDATMTADSDLVVPEDLDGEEDMTVTAENLNADAADPELEQLSQFTGMTVDEIVGLNVLSADGEDVGEIDYVYAEGDQYKAVIGIGGFLGLGEYTVALPLGNFAMLDGELILDQATEAELDAMPEVDESELNELDGDYVIS